MDLKISRQSVCLADDVEDHAITYAIDASTRFSDVFRNLISQGYFPSIFGNDVVWTLFCGDEDLLSWKTREDKLYNRFVTVEMPILSVKRWATACEIYFRYYSPPIKRAQHIFLICGGKDSYIWHEGFKSEYDTYHISPTVEEEWRKTLLR